MHGRNRIAVVTAGLIIVSGWFAFAMAQSTGTPASPPPGTSSGWVRGLQRILGLNRVAELVARNQLEKMIRKKVQGEMDIDIQMYSALDLAQGLARGITFEGRNLVYDHTLHVQHLRLETDPQTPVQFDTKQGELRQPVGARFTIRMTNADLEKSLASPELVGRMQAIRVPLLGAGAEQRIRLISPRILMEAGRLDVQSRVGVAGMPEDQAIPVHIKTGFNLSPTGDRLLFEHFQVVSAAGLTDASMFAPFLQPLLEAGIQPAKLLDLKPEQLKLHSLTIQPDGMTVEGYLLVYPETFS